MQPQRRVSLPAPARTTRMNGGPRLRAGTPLPPYRASPGPARSGFAPNSGAPADATRTASPDPERGERSYTPPVMVEESPVFPMDAFIIPEGSARLPCVPDDTATESDDRDDCGPSPARSAPSEPQRAELLPELVDTAPIALRDAVPRRVRSASMREQRAHDVADRLESLATQLRNHGYEVLAQRSVKGDALDALLAGVIAGYLVAAE